MATVADAATTLMARPWRTLATAAGVILGVASGLFTMMLTASEHGQVGVNFDRQLAAVVVIEGGSVPNGTSPITPLSADLEQRILGAPATYDGGELSIWQRSATVSTSRFGKPTTVPLFGVTPGGLAAAGVDRLAGADPRAPDIAALPGLVWLGQDLARRLDIDPAGGEGQILLVNGHRLTVAGTTTAGTRYPALGGALIVSSSFATDLWGQPEQARTIAHVRRGAAEVAATYLLAALDPTGEARLRNATPPDGRLTRELVGADVERAGTALSVIALAFGVLSVANVLSTSVLQRTKELGLRSALGWTTPRLARLILTEAVLLGVCAAVLGSAAGLTAGMVVARYNGWTAILPTTALWLPPVAGLAAGALGGLLPAIRAGRISPTEALRT